MEVIYEDNHIIAVNKTCREIVQGDKTGDTPLSDMLKAWLKEKYCKPGNVFVGVTQRLDRPVSGVVLFAKTSKALSRLNEMFRNGEVKKTYWAIVKNCPKEPEAELTHYLVRNEKQNKSYAYDKEVKDSKKAVLHYRLIGHSVNYYLLEVDLKTGRHHQIPVHGLFDGILRGVDGVLAFANVLDDGGGDASLLMNLPKGGLLEVFARYYGSFGKSPAVVYVPGVFGKNE